MYRSPLADAADRSPNLGLAIAHTERSRALAYCPRCLGRACTRLEMSAPTLRAEQLYADGAPSPGWCRRRSAAHDATPDDGDRDRHAASKGAFWRALRKRRTGDRSGVSGVRDAVIEQGDLGRDVGLVLGGGGARGAYASGALTVLLPELKDQVSVIVGTSAGALISAYLAANWHRSVEEAIDDGVRFWRELRFGDVLAPLMAPGGAARFLRYVGEFLPVNSLHAPSILHPEPLAQTLDKLVDFDQLGDNIREQQLAVGVVATPAHSNRSVVFHQGGIPRHRDDPLRGIEYVATPKLGAEHILASSAIPALFPAVRVTEPEPAAGWYFDGGPRLNTPIKPALWLGAKRVIVVALNSVAPRRTPAPEQQPNFYVGAAHLLHAALGDPLAQDIRTLANTNALIAAGLATTSATNGRSRYNGQPGPPAAARRR